MKKLLLAVVVLGLTGQAVASKEEFCAGVSGLAEEIMGVRQNGVPISKLVEAISKLDQEPQLKEYTKKIIVTAYDEPRWSTEQHKQQAVTEFGNMTYITCIE